MAYCRSISFPIIILDQISLDANVRSHPDGSYSVSGEKDSGLLRLFSFDCYVSVLNMEAAIWHFALS